MQRKPNRLLSIVTLLIFAVAFLVPSTAYALIQVPDVQTISALKSGADITLRGELTSEGDITEYGFYYDISSDVDETDTKVLAGTGDIDDGDRFSEVLQDMDPDTYYYKAYVIYDTDLLLLADNYASITVNEELDDNGDLDAVTRTAKDIQDDEATLWGYVEVDEEDYDDDIYDIYEYGFFWGDDKGDVEDVEDILDDGDDDWDCDYDSGDDIDYDDGDERYDFNLDLNNLDEDEDYYYRAYIEYTDDNDDNFYSLGDVKRFTADQGTSSRGDEPSVSTNAATDIDNNSATLNGRLRDFGDGDEITSYGFYWGTSSYPTTKEEVGDDSDNLDEGDDFDLTLNRLEPGTTYYFRAYAKTDEGTGYGSTESFTTSGGSGGYTTAMFTIGSSYYIANGKLQTMDAAPYVKNNRTYIPVRYAAYAMGLTDADITASDSVVVLTKGSTVVQLFIGNPFMYVNGSPKMMDVSAEVVNGRTYLPVAWLANAFGHYALWDNTFQTVTIR